MKEILKPSMASDQLRKTDNKNKLHLTTAQWFSLLATDMQLFRGHPSRLVVSSACCVCRQVTKKAQREGAGERGRGAVGGEGQTDRKTQTDREKEVKESEENNTLERSCY